MTNAEKERLTNYLSTTSRNNLTRSYGDKSGQTITINKAPSKNGIVNIRFGLGTVALESIGFHGLNAHFHFYPTKRGHVKIEFTLDNNLYYIHIRQYDVNGILHYSIEDGNGKVLDSNIKGKGGVQGLKKSGAICRRNGGGPKKSRMD